MVSDMPVLLNSEILAEDAVVHEQPGAEFELLPGVAFAVKNEPQLVGDCRPIEFEHGIVGGPLDAPVPGNRR